MRTTVTFDRDVAAMLEARRTLDLSESLGALVNRLLRWALAAQETAARHARPRRRLYTKTVHARTVKAPLEMTSTSDLLDLADAHLAALAMEHGLVVVSADADFRRFPGVRVENPV